MSQYAVTVEITDAYWAIQVLVETNTPANAKARVQDKLNEAQAAYKVDTSQLIVTNVTLLRV